MHELNQLRRNGVYGLTAACWIFVLGLAASALHLGRWLPLAVAVAMSIVPSLLARQDQGTGASRLAFGLTLPLYPALLLWQWAGEPWMLDFHMVFFVTIAMLTVLADWRAILLGAGVTAVHHLLTNFVAPSLVFPGGADLERVLLHAVVVVAETSVLVMVASQVEKLVVGQASAHAETSRLEAATDAERNRAAAEQRQVIDGIGGALKGLAQGDLAARLDQRFPESYEDLRTSFNAAAADLNRMVRAVSDSAGSIQSGSTEIRSASADLAQRTEQQASTLEETALALNRITGTVQDSARSAAELQATVQRTREDALNGGNVADRTVAAMTQIEKSAQEISQIIAVIDGIAFQTNLLALNAGVEAARAGEAGKGFAVVAGEVRALAQRSAEAASNIKELIEVSTTQVARGVELVGESGQSLRSIVEDIGQIGEAIERIAVASQEQAGALIKVNDQTKRLDLNTQQNAAMVEQSTAAACTLSNEAANLAELVTRFHTAASETNAGRTGYGALRAAA
ncbi:methyl-accepting chemotaxis protein [Novosphingobium sp. JCM 18896]|uniref:methyl-accepting chemotaxis protein n=1 Tax=Novosphingobium sp. JCM 18896 TaxID=2989731 RepID=UPI002223AA9E|nr:methyl-accepting chemotaxis protein [Novosphingobium sp. JCM 18896]MCW1431122.1 methyl-accepting chemotaxis protein [Novosphingobium sp. JCM 18896]